MQPIQASLTQPSWPGEWQRLRSALLTDQDGVVTETRRRLARLARARGVEPHAIEDVVQETLLEVTYAKYPAFQIYLCFRYLAGAMPTSRLNALRKATSESYPSCCAIFPI